MGPPGVLLSERDAPLVVWHPAPRWPDGIERGRRWRGGRVPIEPRPASIATSSPAEDLAALWSRSPPALIEARSGWRRAGMGEPLDGPAAEDGESLPPRPRGALAISDGSLPSLTYLPPVFRPIPAISAARPTRPCLLISSISFLTCASAPVATISLPLLHLGEGSPPLTICSSRMGRCNCCRWRDVIVVEQGPDGVERGRRWRGGRVPIEPQQAPIATDSPSEGLAALWPRPPLGLIDAQSWWRRAGMGELLDGLAAEDGESL